MSSADESNALYKSLLQAIYFVKCQRKRPTVERLHQVLLRQHQFQSVSERKIEGVLKAAVRRRELITTVKDDCKAYLEAPGSSVSGACTGLSKFTQTVIDAIDTITREGKTATCGSICNRLSRKLAGKSSNSDLSRRVQTCCSRAVAFGQIKKLANGYVVSNYGRTFLKKTRNRPLVRSIPKLLLDDVLEKKEIAEPIPICSLCLGSAKINREGVAESMLACVDCGRCGHPSCLKFTPQLTETVKKTKWQCIECKMCSICAEAGQEQNMLFCDSCDRGFHMKCCQPPILRRPKGSWDCCICDKGNSRIRFNGSINESTISCCRQRASCGTEGDGEENDNENLEYNIDADDLPPGVCKEDEELFNKAQQRLTKDESGLPESGLPVDQPCRCPPRIEIGKYSVNTWHSSPYPQKFARLSTLFICEQCLTYIDSRSVLNNHMMRCSQLRPPGNEIYRQDNLSIFEVEGNLAKIYCQNLCLLAKLFLDHKTLYYDVEPFVFYVLTHNDECGYHLVGYFSKEKYCQQKYNLSCIMTLPQYQRRGYGRLLIDFSYMLSRVEGVPGSPEKPLSDLGQISYEAYWKDVVLNHIDKLHNKTTSIQGLCELTGISITDILTTMHSLGMFVKSDTNCYSIVVDKSMLDKYKARCEAKRESIIKLDSERLQWTPFSLRSLLEQEEKQTEIELEQISLVTKNLIDDRNQQLPKSSSRGKHTNRHQSTLKTEQLSPLSPVKSSPLRMTSVQKFNNVSNQYRARPGSRMKVQRVKDCSPLNSSTPVHSSRERQPSYRTIPRSVDIPKRVRRSRALSCPGLSRSEICRKAAYARWRELQLRNSKIDGASTYVSRTARKRANAVNNIQREFKQNTSASSVSETVVNNVSNHSTVSSAKRLRTARLSSASNILSDADVLQVSVKKQRRWPKGHSRSSLKCKSRTEVAQLDNVSSNAGQVMEARNDNSSCKEALKRKRNGKWIMDRSRIPLKNLSEMANPSIVVGQNNAKIKKELTTSRCYTHLPLKKNELQTVPSAGIQPVKKKRGWIKGRPRGPRKHLWKNPSTLTDPPGLEEPDQKSNVMMNKEQESTKHHNSRKIRNLSASSHSDITFDTNVENTITKQSQKRTVTGVNGDEVQAGCTLLSGRRRTWPREHANMQTTKPNLQGSLNITSVDDISKLPVKKKRGWVKGRPRLSQRKVVNAPLDSPVVVVGDSDNDVSKLAVCSERSLKRRRCNSKSSSSQNMRASPDILDVSTNNCVSKLPVKKRQGSIKSCSSVSKINGLLDADMVSDSNIPSDESASGIIYRDSSTRKQALQKGCPREQKVHVRQSSESDEAGAADLGNNRKLSVNTFYSQCSLMRGLKEHTEASISTIPRYSSVNGRDRAVEAESRLDNCPSVDTANDETTERCSNPLSIVGSANDLFETGHQVERSEPDVDVMSESTVNYFTDSEVSNCSADEVCEPSQTTIAYWNQSLHTADYSIDVVDLVAVEENDLQQNSDDVTNTKALSSVYGSQLPNAIDCQLICDSTMCIMPTTSPLETAVDMHPLSHVLQKVDRPSLGMTFVR